ncbi:MAG TPA: hypothetical protein VGP55_07555 [Chitinophagaceae bacterium]|nr:hypothetical protein [Chitinophagaceae bacterium]
MLLQEIKLYTRYLYQLHIFYKEVLELPVIYSGEKTICVVAGQSYLIFTEAHDNGDPFYHFAFNIPSHKFEEAFQWLQNRAELLWLEDYKSYIADFVNWHAKSVYFLDPAGNILELIARFDLNDHAGELFSSKQFRNISEIGLVFSDKDFDKKVNEILNKYKLPYFAKQLPLPHFRAVGDDEGLFIAVPENRNWFSTKTASGIFPIEVSFINNKNLYELKM